MNNYFLFIVALICSIYCAYSKQYTVSNYPYTKAQFSNLQTAIDSAASGDTIYVSGSPNNYSDNIAINKPIHLIGEGYNNNNKYNSLTPSVYLYADSVTIEGFNINSFYIGYAPNGTKKPITNISIRFNRIYMMNLYGLSQSIIYNNYIENIVFQSTTTAANNSIFANNVLGHVNFSTYACNLLLANNIFLKPYNCTQVFSHSNCSGNSYNLMLQNNIFYRVEPRPANYSNFVNNLTYASANDALPYGSNTGINNLINIDPKFKSANINLTISTFLNYDLSLSDDSPCKNAGTDSTDLGLTGGYYPWPIKSDGKLDISGCPRTPTIEQFDLLQLVVGKDGTLRFNTQVIRKK